jgi:23S rRNA pseudouridine1911/1915/1917 synthase
VEETSFTFIVTEDESGLRLDKFLVRNLPEEFSRTFIQELVTDGNVLANGERVKNHHKIGAGESIEVVVPETKEATVVPEDIPLDIVYEDGDIIVVNKPSGMVVHPAPGNFTGTLANALLFHCKKLSGSGDVLKPGIVHRLDKGTSGLLIVAKTDGAHQGLAKQFKARTLKKIYIAVVKGVVQLDNGIIELPIGRHTLDRKRMAVKFVDSKDASTRYMVLERFKDATLLEIALDTGRTHQIRVHMSYIGHPIIGDEKYGYAYAGIERPALHAKTIGFDHPTKNKYVEFTAEIPDDMRKLINGLKKDRTGK